MSRELKWLLLGSGGAVLLAVLVILVSTSNWNPSDTVPPPAPKRAKIEKKVVEEAPVVSSGSGMLDTGAILFVCANSGNHPDKEVWIRDCKHCAARVRFYWDAPASAYRCRACSKVHENADIKCPDCGRFPKVTRLRPS